MSYVEYTGKTVKDAIAKACQELNVEESLLEVEVIEESARGFLGLVGHRNARVRVRKRDIIKEALEVQAPQPVEMAATFPIDKGTDAESGDGINGEIPSVESKATSGCEDVDPEKLKIAEEAKSVLQGIISRIPVEASVEASVSNDSIVLNIIGDKSGLLIGKRGQTLDALQFIINKALNREVSLEEKTEIVVDTEDYRRRKHENLRDMAVKMSMKARRSLKPVAFNPMPASERRIIHLILAEDKEVYTKSYGEGPLRRIIVYPRKAMANKRRRR
ncbi:MAG: RNA-binding cell elongation regulator Jag/EloR [Desulfomonilaceae bacterium]